MLFELICFYIAYTLISEIPSLHYTLAAMPQSLAAQWARLSCSACLAIRKLLLHSNRRKSSHQYCAQQIDSFSDKPKARNYICACIGDLSMLIFDEMDPNKRKYIDTRILLTREIHSISCNDMRIHH